MDVSSAGQQRDQAGEVADALRARTRSHDLLIRDGGDVFLCAISGATPGEAAIRFAEVNAGLATAPNRGLSPLGSMRCDSATRRMA